MNKKTVHIKSAVFLSRRKKGDMEGLHSQSGNERPGRPCQLAALSGRRAAQDGQGAMPGGPERAGVSFQAMARAVLFAVAAVGLFVGPATAADPIPVGPGATGALTWAITADASSVFVIGGVKVEAEVSACFIDTNQAQRSAFTLAAGQTQVVRVEYKIADNAAEGICTASLHLKTAQPNVAASLRNIEVQFMRVRNGPTIVASSVETVPRDLHGDGISYDPTTSSYGRSQSNTLDSAPWTAYNGVDLRAVGFATMDVFSPSGATILHALGDGVSIATAVITGLPNASGYLMTLDQGIASEQNIYFNRDNILPRVTISNAVQNGDGTVTVTGTAVAGVSGVQKVCLVPADVCSAGGGAASWPFILTLPLLCGSQVIEVYNVAGIKGLDAWVSGGCAGGPITWESSPSYSPPAVTLDIGFAHANAYVALKDVHGTETIAMRDPPVQLPGSYFTLTSSEAWTIQVSNNHSGPGYVDLAFNEYPVPGGRALGQSAEHARMLAVGVDGSVTDVSHDVSAGRRMSRGALTGATLYTVGVTSQVATMFLDFAAPVSRINGIGPLLEGRDGGVFIATDTRIQLNSTEFGNDGYVSGSSRTFYAVDQVFIDSVTTPGTFYEYSPISVAPGAHSFWYYSVDAAGNVEPVRTARITATAGMASGTVAPGVPSAVARTSTTVELAWAPGANPAGTVYEVKVATSCGSSPSWSVGTDSPSDVVSGLAPGTSYYFSACTYGLDFLGLPNCSVPVGVATGLAGREGLPPYQLGCEGGGPPVSGDILPPRTALAIGDPSFDDGTMTYVTNASLLGLRAEDDKLVVGDGLGVGTTQTFYAEDGGAYLRFSSSFSLVAEGTHTISFFSIDLEGRTEAVKTQTVAVDLTAPVVALVSSGTLFTITSVDPVVGGAASGVEQIQYLVDLSPDCADGPLSTAAANGTCENPSYAGPFELVAGTHTVYYAASDRLLNGDQVVYSSFVTVGPPVLMALAITPSTASIEVAATAQFEAVGTFSDGSTRTLMGEVTWTTDAPTVATISVSGLATGMDGGTAHVIASLGSIEGQATLMVTLPPLTVSSISPDSAETGVSVVAAVVGTGFNASAALTLEFSDVLRGAWTATGSFTDARFGGTLTKLRDGRVLLAGGMHDASVTVGLSTVDLYDPATGAWTSASPLLEGRNQYAAVRLADGRVLVAGGRGPNGSILNTAEIYDPATGAWTAAGAMAGSRLGHVLALLPDGRVLAAGGYNGNALSSAEIYDPLANAWSTAASMSAARYYPAPAVLSDGKVLISGGINDSAVNVTAEIYDPATNAWSSAGTMSVGRFFHRAVVLPNGKALVSGGGDPNGVNLNTAEVYDPATNGWTATNPFNDPRYIHAMVMVGGKAMIIAGENASTALASTAIYDVATNAWSQGPSLTGMRAWPLAAVLNDGRVLVAGGRQGLGGGADLNTAELLDVPSASIAATAVSVTDARHMSATVDLTGAATGYWDVVVRETGGQVGRLDGGFRVLPGAPTLTSIAVTPSTASILAGATTQFEAAGAFTDGSTRTLTGEVAWTTDVSLVVTVSSTGLALGVGGGTAHVIASSGAITGQATLTVTLPPLTVSSISPDSAESGASVIAAIVGTGFNASPALSLERSDTLRGTWRTTNSFTQGRFMGTLTKLRDGRVLLAGGIAGGDTTSGSAAVDLYDPATGLWTAGPPLNQGRNQYSAVRLIDGRVLVAGGYGPGTPLRSVEIYDPSLNAWTTVAPMGTVRSWFQLAMLSDGRVLAAGGSDGAGYLSSAEIYNPTTNVWSPAASMSEGHAGAAGATLNDGKVLIAGGFGPSATAAVYNPATNAWATAGSMSEGRSTPSYALLPNGKVLVTGGSDGGTADVYDPATNSWTATGAMTVPRNIHALALVNGTALVIAGENSSVSLASTEIYDAATNVWRPGPALTSPRTWTMATTLDDGRVLAAGGLGLRGALGSTLNTAELLDAPSASIAAADMTVTDAQHLTGTLALSGAATGYWDVVVRETDGRIGRLAGGFLVLPPTLTSLAITPSTASILAGATAQFTAAGTFTDGSTRTMTGEVAWMTDASSVATASSTGLVLGVSGGTAHVIASSGAVSGQATLNVAYVATSTVAVNGSPELTLVSTAPFSVVLVSTEAGVGAVALGSAAAQGMILVSAVYDVTRQDPGATATLTWFFDPALVDAATLAIWRFDGISWSSVTVLNQVVSVAGGVGTVTGEVVRTSLYALFSIDAAAPVTTLLVDGLPAGATSLSLVPASTIGFTAIDAGVGVRETRYVLDGGAEAVFVSTFSLAAGAHALTYLSVDRAGNQEAARTVAIAVTNPSGDTAPPLVRLDFPGASALGVERTVGGVVSVRGSADDASVLIWTLSAGLTVLASGTGNVTGALAAWDTAALSGPQTLTLSAVDVYGNAASTSAQVFVGAPVMTFAIGRKDSDAIVSTLKGPTGIAVRSDGAIWVASTENDQILLISPAGVLLGAAGQAPGHSGEDKERDKKENDKKGKKDEDRDDKKNEHGNLAGLSFKSPQGLALDASDQLYVADRDLNRVVKLSADGQALLLKLGKAGSGLGELKRPFDVAVDGNGDVYVADSGNRRISVFNASGIFLRQFGQGALPSDSEVRGIALTSEGLWVSDKESERIYLFSRAGGLLKSIGGADSVVGEISRTRGLAADRLGALYVVEPNRDRAQKFDPQGKGLLSFGNKAGLSHADKLAKRYLTHPIDAAVAPDGSLWITDAGRDRIVRYALPVSGGYGVAALSAGSGEVSSSSIEPAKRIVDHADGATVSRDDGVGVLVPKGALAADLEITVDKGDENLDKEQKTAKRREMKITAVSEEVQYGPEGTTFNTPVTLTVPYDANLLAAQGIREDELKVYYWNPGLKDWQAMPSTVDKLNKTVNAQTTHFSAYQVQGPGGGIGVAAAAVDEFGLHDQYAFPNPSRNGVPVIFRLQPGLADSVEVRVYDLSGRKVHSSSDFRFSVLDDGNGKGTQNTYDHAWDVSGVGSGVYTYVIKASRAGQPPIVKSGKAGVIK
jgi:sugar lactone lactonase YvrE/N-acetylneuraminic acid mutarotase